MRRAAIATALTLAVTGGELFGAGPLDALGPLAALTTAGVAHADAPATGFAPTRDARHAAPTTPENAFCPPGQANFLPPSRSPDPTRTAEAQSIDRDAAGVYRAEGDAQLDSQDQSIRAERIVYDPTADRITADAGIELRTPDLIVRGSRLEYRISLAEGRITDAQYWLRTPTARSGAGRGRAEEIRQLGEGRFRAEQIDYTTCPDGNDDWVLSTRRLDIDQASGFATARDAVLRFKGVPFLHAPWFRFPIDDRRHTGLLAPTLQRSDRRGTELATPFYWNIAPNRDATFTPRWMSRRGLLLETEWRTLQRWGSAELDANILQNDRVAGEDRHFLRLQSDARLPLPGGDWRWTIDATDLSDPSYLRDFGQRDLGSDLNFVERQTQLSRRVGRGQLSILAQGFQIANPLINNEPYQRLPQIRLTQEFGDVSSAYGQLALEHTRFDRSVGVVGQRANIDLRTGLRWQPSFWYVEPRLGLRVTHYDLSRTPATIDRQSTRVVPDVSVELGADFERPSARGLQTLEPRLFYGYVPFRDQSRLPTFDTSALSFDLDRLFTNERFVGGDRVGDIHQVSALVTTRFLDFDRGLDRLALSLGARHLFDDPRVAGPGTGRGFDPRQALLGRVEYAFNPRLSLDAQTGYDLDRRRVDFGDVALRYRSRGERLISLNYRYQAGGLGPTAASDVELADVSTLWPISRRSQVVGLVSYDLDQGRTVDVIGGLAYRSCCYGVRVLARRSFAEELGQFENGLFVQFTLDGLSGYDTGIERTLKESIPGYDTTR